MSTTNTSPEDTRPEDTTTQTPAHIPTITNPNLPQRTDEIQQPGIQWWWLGGVCCIILCIIVIIFAIITFWNQDGGTKSTFRPRSRNRWAPKPTRYGVANKAFKSGNTNVGLAALAPEIGQGVSAVGTGIGAAFSGFGSGIASIMGAV